MLPRTTREGGDEFGLGRAVGNGCATWVSLGSWLGNNQGKTSVTSPSAQVAEAFCSKSEAGSGGGSIHHDSSLDKDGKDMATAPSTDVFDSFLAKISGLWDNCLF